MGGGINGQSQLVPSPPGQQPPEQGWETKLSFQLGMTGRSLIPAIIKPLSEVLAQAVPPAHHQQGGDHRVLAGAVGQDSPLHPKGKTQLL